MTRDVTSRKPGEDLGWLLEQFLKKVPETTSALLASRDGMKLAAAELTTNQADKMAAVMSGVYSLARGAGGIKTSADPGAAQRSGVRQIVVEGEGWYLFVMSAGPGLPEGVPVQAHTDPDTVSTLLGVLTTHEADVGIVGHEMTTLCSSIAEHLFTPTRRGQ